MNIDILDESLLKSLMDETISFYEVMNAYNIRTSIACNLPSSILGFVYVSRRGNYHLILMVMLTMRPNAKLLFMKLSILHMIYPVWGT